jgi:hypothetical protein
VGSLGAILGALPDLLGVFGLFVLADDGKLYNSAHSGSIKSVMQYVPMYWLHLFFDSFMHDPERTWGGIYLRNSLELGLWVVNVALVVWFTRIWIRNSSTAQLPFP